MEAFVFFVAALIVLVGAVGVIIARNPVHSALMLVQTLFGVAVLFVNLEAHFLAAVQVIVYAGAIVILFLFVIMFLGVDRAEDLSIEPIAGQRPIAAVAWAGTIATILTVVLISADNITGAISATGELGTRPDINRIGELLFTRYVFAFEITALLLTVAVIGAVVLARRVKGELEPIPDDDIDHEAAR